MNTQELVDGKLLYECANGKCYLELSFLSLSFSSQSTDLFSSLNIIREEMYPNIPVCKGAQINVHPSGMSSQMSGGVKAYIRTMGKRISRNNVVNIFDDGDIEHLGTVEEQNIYLKEWYESIILSHYGIDYSVQKTKKLDRFRGCLLGLACGDALGTTLEFKSSGSFKPISDMIGGGPFNLVAGQWTDDTSMALCMAESFLEKKEFDLKVQMDNYVKWYKDGYLSSTGKCFDIGQTIKKALDNYIATGNPVSGSKDKLSAGNGSLMRLAPVPMFFSNNYYKAINMSAESSKTTHQAVEAIDACRFYGSLIVKALNGDQKEVLLEPLDEDSALYKTLSPKVQIISKGNYKEKVSSEVKGTGYVIDTLEVALWAFYNSKTFEKGALLVANLGGDADTTTAVYGQLAGAYYGENQIPKKWLSEIFYYDIIGAYATGLYVLSK